VQKLKSREYSVDFVDVSGPALDTQREMRDRYQKSLDEIGRIEGENKDFWQKLQEISRIEGLSDKIKGPLVEYSARIYALLKISELKEKLLKGPMHEFAGELLKLCVEIYDKEGVFEGEEGREQLYKNLFENVRVLVGEGENEVSKNELPEVVIQETETLPQEDNKNEESKEVADKSEEDFGIDFNTMPNRPKELSSWLNGLSTQFQYKRIGYSLEKKKIKDKMRENGMQEKRAFALVYNQTTRKLDQNEREIIILSIKQVLKDYVKINKK